jgi:DNA-binding winged helix-turn-helix (wHTH) protein
MRYSFAPYELDLAKRLLTRAGRHVPIQPRAFDLLRYLIEHRDRSVTRRELIERLWPNRFVGDESLTQSVAALRRVLADRNGRGPTVKTVYGHGYRFVGRVDVRGKDPSASQAAAATDAAAAPTGRAVELAALQHALNEAVAGHRQLVFVTGEIGIGKTTLVEAFLRSGVAPGVRVARGQCVDQHGGAEPFMPVLEALTHLCHQPGGEAVVTLLRHYAPTWLAQMPSVASLEERRQLSADPLASKPAHMMRLMVEAIERIAAAAPLVFVLEDAHWSDRAALDLLAAIARRSQPARLLVLVTYRPDRAAEHAAVFTEIIETVRRQGCGLEMPLRLLSEPEVSHYIAARFPNGTSLSGLGAFVHRHTAGHPLFMTALADHFETQGWVAKTEAGFQLSVSLDVLEPGVPATVERIVDLQVDAMAAADVERLQAASVAGDVFAARAAAAACGEDPVDAGGAFARLARRTHIVHRHGEARWPDGSVSGQFAFVHALFRRSIYDRIPPARRRLLHQRIGERIEAAYAGDTALVAAELARHFQRSGDAQRAARYLRESARLATARGALREASQFLFAALQELSQLQPTAAHQREELSILQWLTLLCGTHFGFHEPSVGLACSRGRALARQLGDKAGEFRATIGLLTHSMRRGEIARAREHAHDLEQLARAIALPAVTIIANVFVGWVAYVSGDFSAARSHLEGDFDEASLPPTVAAADIEVLRLALLSFTLAALGALDGARQRARQMMTRAQQLQSTEVLMQAHFFSALLATLLGDPAEARVHASAIREIARGESYPDLLPAAAILRAWGESDGATPAVPAQMEQLLIARRAAGQRLNESLFCALLAQAHAAQGQTGAALEAVGQGLAFAEQNAERCHLAELQRIKGVLLWRDARRRPGNRGAQRRNGARAMQQRRPAALHEAEACLQQAIDIARSQGARLLELRATVSLAHLWQVQGRRADAAQRLGALYDSCSEGHDTPDLHAAADLLRVLRSATGRAPNRLLAKGLGLAAPMLPYLVHINALSDWLTSVLY